MRWVQAARVPVIPHSSLCGASCACDVLILASSVYESLLGRYRPRSIARPTAMRVGSAKSRAKVLVDPPAAPICNRCRLCSSVKTGGGARLELARFAAKVVRLRFGLAVAF